MIDEEDEFKFDFDVLDPTKIWPEELIPVKIIGKMTLDQNVTNVFAETEQVAFHPGHVVPGIDFSNDPLLQGRLFSYTDTQLTRLGGPNFHELPINRPVCPFHNNQRDGMHRMTIDRGQVSYHKNSLQSNYPKPAPASEGGYEHYQEKMEGRKVRERSDSFKDHYSQAILFWNSMTEVEKQHIIDAFSFEIGKVKSKDVQQQVVDMLGNIDTFLAAQVAVSVGAKKPANSKAMEVTLTSPALSQLNTVKLPNTRKVAILADHGFNSAEVTGLMALLKKSGITAEIISKNLGMIKGDDGKGLEVNHTLLTSSSVLYDALFIAGGQQSVDSLKQKKEAVYFVDEAFSHFKAVGAGKEASALLTAAGISLEGSPGVVVFENSNEVTAESQKFIDAIIEHRHWNRMM